jgi:citrate synthase
LYYRGHDAVVLARSWSVEEVAALIWTGERSAAADLFAGEAPVLPESLAGILDRQDLSPVERCQVAVPLAGALDLSGWDLRPRAVMKTGTRILRLLAATAAGARSTSSSPIAAVLQSGWAPGRPEVAEALGAALILCADHELNVSAFTARCVASAAATKPELATSLIEAARELIGEPPNLDFGLVTLARGLGLPERTPLALFALGRSIGWIGHALEEYALDRLIRPRAAYVGEPAGTLQET